MEETLFIHTLGIIDFIWGPTSIAGSVQEEASDYAGGCSMLIILIYELDMGLTNILAESFWPCLIVFLRMLALCIRPQNKVKWNLVMWMNLHYQ